MEPNSEGIIQVSGGVHERNRRAWGVFTLSVAGAGAFFAFLNGSFIGSANSAATVSDAVWRTSLAGEVRQAISVPGDFTTIQQAIDAAPEGATILVSPGVYRERIDLQERTLHLWGVGGAGSTRLVGDGVTGPVAHVRGGSVQFDGITFQGGRGNRAAGRPFWTVRPDSPRAASSTIAAAPAQATRGCALRTVVSSPTAPRPREAPWKASGATCSWTGAWSARTRPAPSAAA